MKKNRNNTCAKTLLLMLLFFNINNANAQIVGTLVDLKNEYIVGASVVLQTLDSVYIDACITDVDGRFSFKQKLNNYRLIIQHLCYKTKQLTVINGNIPLPIILEERSENLKEVVVKATRPIVKVNDNGGLVYNTKQLIATRPVTNGLDLLEEVPGVVKNGDNLSIVGAGSTNIIINGHKRSMSVDDLKQLLAATPLSQIKSVEVFYNTPPQYGVKGGCINVVMDEKRSEKTSWNGNAYTIASLGKEYYQTGVLNFSLFQKKWSFDVGYAFGFTNKKMEEDFISNHHIGNNITNLAMDTRRHSKNTVHQIKTSFSYDFKNKDRFSFLYIAKFGKPKNNSVSPLLMENNLVSESLSDLTTDYQIHTFNAEFIHKKLTIGGDYVYYNSDKTQDMQIKNGSASVNSSLSSCASQKVNKANFYMNHSSKIGKGIFNYGLDASLSSTDNAYSNQWNGNSNYDNETSNSTQNEYAADVFAGWSQKFGKTSILSANLQVQYYHADMKLGEKKSTLWNGVYFFPSLTFNHTISKNQTIVFTLSSKRVYPGYSSTSDNKSYSNSYIYSVGNPSLKPYTSYESHLNYIIKRKYVLGAFANFQPDWITQQIYQDPNKLQASYRWLNFDYYNQFGIIGIIPHKWNNFIDSRLTVNLIYAHQKGVLIDVPFNRERATGKFNLSNNFSLNKAKTWAFQLNASYQTEAIQGLYDAKPMFDSSLALAWNPEKSGWSLTLKANDLFNTSNQKLDVDYANQHFNFKYNRDMRYVSLTARYTFNNYKQKNERMIDTSRMGL